MPIPTVLVAWFLAGPYATDLALAATPPARTTPQGFDRLLAERNLPNRAGAAVLLKRGPDVLFRRAYGMASLDYRRAKGGGR